MNRCPITYQEVSGSQYSNDGLKKLNNRLTKLLPIPFNKEELLEEAAIKSEKISIEGVQPKLSVSLSIVNSSFEFVEKNGTYILKPQQMVFPRIPENEDLTMRLAQICGIIVPIHGMIYDKTGELHYFIKRFDRWGRKSKYPIEDFAQLSGKTRGTKYKSSMEKVAGIVEEFCTFPIVEKAKLFRLTIFNFLTGNEDMHLKNFSLITINGVTTLSPAYDLLNTTMVMKNVTEEIALPISGKKRNLKRKDLFDYYGKDRLGLNDQTLNSIENDFKKALPNWERIIDISFLSPDEKGAYSTLVHKRAEVLDIS